MATASDVIKRAFQLIGVQASEAPIEAAEMADGLDALNDLMAMWKGQGVDIGYEAITDADSTILIDDYVEDVALAAMKPALAIRLAPEYDKPISNVLSMNANESYKALLQCVVQLGVVEYPDSLPTGSGNWGETFFR